MPASRTRFGRADRACARSHRGGFTLLEVVVALTVGAIALLGARLMLSAMADSADAIDRAATGLDRKANAERVLRSMLRQVETTNEDAQFGGDRHTASFTTWCTMPGGWQERCRATLTIGGGADSSGSLVMTFSTGEALELRSGFAQGELRYIGETARGGTWFEVWGDGIALPAAVGVLLDSDTLIMRLGVR